MLPIDMYTQNRYIMIKSFADKETEKIYCQTVSAKLPQKIQKTALRKLIMIDRGGQYSIRINDQYRICFRMQDGDATDVEIVDYH